MLIHHLAISVFHRGRYSRIPEYGLAATTMNYTADTDPPPFSRTSDIKIFHYTLPSLMDKSKPSSQEHPMVHLCLELPKNPHRLSTTRDIIVVGFVHLPWTLRPHGFDILKESEIRVSAQKLASRDAGRTLGQCAIHSNSSIEDIEKKSETRSELSLELVLSVLRRVSYEVEAESQPFKYCLELHLVARMYLQSDDKGPNRVPVPVIPFEAMKIVADSLQVIAEILIQRKWNGNLPVRFVFPFNYLFLSGAPKSPTDSPSSRQSWRKDWTHYASGGPYRALLGRQVDKIVKEGFPVEDGVSVKVKYDPWDPFRPIFKTKDYDDDR